MDSGGVYTLGKPNTFSVIENLSLFTTFTSSPVSPRLLRHVSIITLPELAGSPLTTVLTDSLRSHCAGRAGLGAGSEVSENLSSVVESTAAVFLAVRERLRPSDLPGRQHYLFSFTHIESVFQVMQNIIIFCFMSFL